MNQYVVATIFTALSAAFMLVVLRGVETDKLRIAAIWTAASAIAFLVRIDGVTFILLGVMLLALAPMRASTRVGVYLAVFMALPHYLDYEIPFPGLNYFMRMDYAKLATLILLAPLLFSKSILRPPAKFRTIEYFLLAFVLIGGVMSIRDLPFTSMMRHTLDMFILIYIPYVVISRSMESTDDVESVLRALFAGIVILGAIGVVSSFKNWNYFAALGEQLWTLIYTDQRGGFLRIHATSGPPILALSMGIGVIVSLYLSSKSKLSTLQLFVLFPVFAFVMYVSGSRGGQFASGIAIAAYFILPRLSGFLRRLVMPLFIAVAAGFVAYALQEDIVFEDAYGTFQYRAEVLRVGFRHILQEPIFGSLTVTELPEFQVLRQGQGIVDLVNSYLQIALYYGLVGLALFLGAQYMALSNAFHVFSAMEDARSKTALDRDDAKRLCAVIVAMHVSYLALIFTTSNYNWTWQFGYAILGLQSGMAIAVARAPQRQSAKPKANAVEVKADKSKRADAPNDIPPHKPYGARFVRRR